MTERFLNFEASLLRIHWIRMSIETTTFFAFKELAFKKIVFNGTVSYEILQSLSFLRNFVGCKKTWAIIADPTGKVN